MPSRLIPLTLEEITFRWRPGSHDRPWTWDDEALDLFTRDAERTELLYSAIQEKGWGLADAEAPVQLGNDGRVWNGHHRIVLALRHGIPMLMCDIIETPYQRGYRDGYSSHSQMFEEFEGDRFAKIAYHHGYLYGTTDREKDEEFAKSVAA